MFRYLRVLESAKYRKAIESCRGVVINHGETEMKLNSGNSKIGIVNIMVRTCSINSLDGKRSDFMPVLSKLPGGKALILESPIGIIYLCANCTMQHSLMDFHF